MLSNTYRKRCKRFATLVEQREREREIQRERERASTDRVRMMSVQTKRPLESKKASSPEEMSPASKRRERKPGRKPLETEAKDKRTAQNRAAQRAFRERRERKMQELEEKVSHLESINKQSELETKFLRSQVTNLLSELQRYNPDLPKKRDSLLLEYIAKQRKSSTDSTSDLSSLNSSSNPISNSNFHFEFPWKVDPSKMPSPSSDSTSPSNSVLDSANGSNISSNSVPNSVPNSTSTSTSTLLKDKDNTLNLYQTQSNVTSEFDFDSQFDESVSNFCSKLSMACGTKSNPIPRASPISNPSSSDLLKVKKESPTLTSESSLSSIPTNFNTSMTPNANMVSSPSTTASWNQPSFGQLGFRNDQLFDLDLSSTTNDKDNNTNHNSDGINWNLNAPSTNFISRGMQNPELSFIDTSIAFPDYDDPLLNILKEEHEEQQKEDLDPIQALINEEPSLPLSHEIDSDIPITSQQTPASNPATTDNSNSFKSPSSVTRKSNLDEALQDIIPSNDGQLLKCSEVWDRITAHPRYSDLDIDGLCLELRTKAKCSEKGVVVNADDVQNALLKHMQ